MDERLVSPDSQVEDQRQTSLRPKRLEEFVGQEKIRNNLQVFIQAAKARNESLEHVLLYGPPGLGKTTMANIISEEMDVNIKTTSGPAIERPGDLAAILTSLEPHDVLFIDEIHRLNRAVEEVLYPALEDYELDIVIGKGPSARSIRLNLEPFTLIGATTRVGLLSAPLRDRFGFIERMQFYTPEELVSIVSRSASLLDSSIVPDAALEVAKRSRGTPRIANRMLKRVRDWAQIKGDGEITLPIVKDALASIDIDEKGLDESDRRYLRAVVEKFSGGPVGLDTIAASLAEESDTFEDVIEPYLLQLGFIERTPRGRMATKLAYDYLGHPYQEKEVAYQQDSLFTSSSEA